MEIKVNLSHSENQMRDFFKFHLMRRSPSRYVYFTFALGLLIAGLVFFILRNQAYAIFFFFVAILIMMTRRIAANSTVLKILKSFDKKSSKYSLLFKEDSVTYEAGSTIKELKYSNLVRAYENKKRYLYLYYNRNGAIILNIGSINQEQYATIKKYLMKYNKYKKSRIL